MDSNGIMCFLRSSRRGVAPHRATNALHRSHPTHTSLPSSRLPNGRPYLRNVTVETYRRHSTTFKTVADRRYFRSESKVRATRPRRVKCVVLGKTGVLSPLSSGLYQNSEGSSLRLAKQRFHAALLLPPSSKRKQLILLLLEHRL